MLTYVSFFLSLNEIIGSSFGDLTLESTNPIDRKCRLDEPATYVALMDHGKYLKGTNRVFFVIVENFFLKNLKVYLYLKMSYTSFEYPVRKGQWCEYEQETKDYKMEGEVDDYIQTDESPEVIQQEREDEYDKERMANSRTSKENYFLFLSYQKCDKCKTTNQNIFLVHFVNQSKIFKLKKKHVKEYSETEQQDQDYKLNVREEMEAGTIEELGDENKVEKGEATEEMGNEEGEEGLDENGQKIVQLYEIISELIEKQKARTQDLCSIIPIVAKRVYLKAHENDENVENVVALKFQKKQKEGKKHNKQAPYSHGIQY
ncbi:hypothetical protein RFI_38076 [Reticulomyxa filosa]|uniref:Uncharacterized protein n=1 Tax=Reticulomyxa filosa TaxID=46433 RepID=X6LDI7_RETFI|nr:hypothetical protein RFI_38076 [Reticulomyxa filosa]|eukprot:ETN99405.1 hypothetical protein RFI_38076 [Reticulomyxa filosa]